MRATVAGLTLGILLSGPSLAQVIYPINRAEILAGSKFDLKVEFASIASAGARVTVNGRDHAEALGRAATLIAREDDKDQSSLLIRDLSIDVPGEYIIVATDGTASATVKWTVYAAPVARRAKNVILVIGDGMTPTNVTAARMLQGNIHQGRYGRQLQIDSLPVTATVGTSGQDSIVTDSANSASAYNTGHKSGVNALGVYASRAAGTLDHPKVETLGEIIKRRLNMAVGIVTNTEIQDATPAAVFSHTRRRTDYIPITDQMLTFAPDVTMGGGSATFLPQATAGSRRRDQIDMIEAYKKAGYTFVEDAAGLAAAANPATTKLLGLFSLGNMDGALDRFYLKKGNVPRFPNQPDLTDQVRVALSVLERNPNGFYLMIESGMIDKYNHALDAERAHYDTIMLDQAVKVVMDWMGARNDTLLIVVADHAHGMGLYGTIDDAAAGEIVRDKVGVYAQSGEPTYGPVDERGYPADVNAARRLMTGYAATPDYYETFRPSLDGPRVPAVRSGPDGPYVANGKFNVPGSVMRSGNLPRDAEQGVHTADDVILRATGPGSEIFRGFTDNTAVFRAMAEALGLGRP